MDKVFNKLRTLDAYPKVNEDFYSRTLSGGLITLLSSLLIIFLFFSEFNALERLYSSVFLMDDSEIRRGEPLRLFGSAFCKATSGSGVGSIFVEEVGKSYILAGLYLHTVTETKLLVDTSRGEKLRINFDVTFPSIPCSLLSVDVMDISGEQHMDIRHDIAKKRIDTHHNVIETRQDGIGAPKIEKPLQKHGGRLEHNETYCGTCYGAETSDEHCCNTCEEVRDAYRKKGWALTNIDMIDQCKREGFVQKVKEEEGEGCNIVGSLEVNKVAGNFHFSPGKTFDHSSFHLQDLLAIQNDIYNISHRINRLSFGDYFPGVVNPLDGVKWAHESQYGMYQYFIKVVPTIYIDIRGRTIKSNQYSVTEHFRSNEVGRPQAFPGVFFFYDFSPIKVTFREEHMSFLHFITHICAIVGGIFTVAGIVDSFVYHGQRAIKKKRQIGKFS